jgi:hypothetical protein
MEEGHAKAQSKRREGRKKRKFTGIIGWKELENE